ncbi:hypothetical protein PR048_026883 [Dryococelus australis]|uniref:Uncharacterized protein n=1 Tax=Dryococelus australis TaxID=614101 RepID=A0ABQ9GML6_9NEOP|nr:hypothetical protein PR048_026883 [Dryococelus australis]
MATRFKKKLKTKLQGKKLEDGKPFGGRGCVTDSAIADIQKYYGWTMRRNSNNLQVMRGSVWAEYFHLLSFDDPQHGLCPKGAESWCKYQRAKTKDECYKYADHFHVPRVMVEEMKPIFRDLSEPELLKKCLHGRTQNSNENVNSVIWNRLPKTTFIGVRTLHFGVWDAVTSFEEGNLVMFHVYTRLGFPPGRHLVRAMKRLDGYRID